MRKLAITQLGENTRLELEPTRAPYTSGHTLTTPAGGGGGGSVGRIRSLGAGDIDTDAATSPDALIESPAP
jgi:hypothetical protein